VQVTDDEVYLVVNAGCREKDISHMQKHLDSFSVRTMLVECAAVTWHSNPLIVTTMTAALLLLCTSWLMIPLVLQGKCELVVHDDRALLALQGPSAVKVFVRSLAAFVPTHCFVSFTNIACRCLSMAQHDFCRCFSHLWTWTCLASISATSTSWTSMASPAT
jgi:glycine cleavage system aminomethyltransferase T